MSNPVERLRALCLALPATGERVSHGEVAFFAGTTDTSARMFVMLDENHHPQPGTAERLGFWCAAPAGAQAEMIDEDPEHFYRPPYVGTRGWLGVRLDRSPDWSEIALIVREAYRCVVPASLAARLEAESGP